MKFTLPAIALIGLAGATSAFGQTSITGLGQSFTETFDSFAGTAATVPSRLSFSGIDFDPGGFYTFSDAYTNSNSTYAFRASGTSTDIAFGEKGLTSSARFLNWAFTNNTGAAIASFQISWNALQYSAAGRATPITQNYNAGSGFTTLGLEGNVFTASTQTTAGQLGSIVNQAMTSTLVLAAPLANGSSITFGWVFGNGAGTGANAHVAVDNITITAIPEPSSFAAFAGLAALGGAALRRRRRAA